MKNHTYNIFLLITTLLIASCYKDKGNYDYSEYNSIQIQDIPDQINVLGNIDTLTLNPKIVSLHEGEIAADNDNYSFAYVRDLNVSAGKMGFIALDSTFSKDLNYFVNLTPKMYDISFIVTDKRTGVQTFKPFKLNVGSAVTEGWMVLCNEGAEQRVRLDMVSVISPTRSVQAFDLAEPLGLPKLNKGTKMSYLYRNPITAKITIVTENQGAYDLLQQNLQSGATFNLLHEFGNKTENCKPQNIQRTASGHYIIIDGDNNAYSQQYTTVGPMFEFPVNTSLGDRKPEFKMSKYIVADAKASGGSNAVLGYDITNKRFVNWSSGRRTSVLPFTDPEQALFSYNTGKDIVYMESTLFANSTAYTILEKDGKRSLHGIRFVAANPVGRFEQSLYRDLDLPNIQQAKFFAFHSTLPYMFYASGSKLYQYDYIANTNKLMKDFGKEHISMLKFNLFRFNITTKPQTMLNQQYDLIVGTTDADLPEKSHGTLRFFNVPPLNEDLTIIKEYKGFADIVDVAYKEVPTF
ncbi:PKD-like family lipoprotein [Sphingobacterium paucimobilis]|uniref:PKD-like family protein n=1 Tax=Sphingobacterium paucimobilis HER1398 TaxID=1346330 RepID=U2HWW8_9SPHI|nr:PKD-like family lipoprotein [Sphingobacterium paucimobilis]ERJ60022.1 hypothetical protein M472_14755 [Sphingobacterium paucimobilis HER1398]